MVVGATVAVVVSAAGVVGGAGVPAAFTMRFLFDRFRGRDENVRLEGGSIVGLRSNNRFAHVEFIINDQHYRLRHTNTNTDTTTTSHRALLGVRVRFRLAGRLQPAALLESTQLKI